MSPNFLTQDELDNLLDIAEEYTPKEGEKFLDEKEISDLLGLYDDEDEEVLSEELIAFQNKLCNENFDNKRLNENSSNKEIIELLKKELNDIFLEYQDEWIISCYTTLELLDKEDINFGKKLIEVLKEMNFNTARPQWSDYHEQIKRNSLTQEELKNLSEAKEVSTSTNNSAFSQEELDNFVFSLSEEIILSDEVILFKEKLQDEKFDNTLKFNDNSTKNEIIELLKKDLKDFFMFYSEEWIINCYKTLELLDPNDINFTEKLIEVTKEIKFNHLKSYGGIERIKYSCFGYIQDNCQKYLEQIEKNETIN